jgi:hypothetical protein
MQVLGVVGLAGLDDLVEHDPDLVPHLGPGLGTRQAGGGLVAKRRHERVVVDLDVLRTTERDHRDARGENHSRGGPEAA